MGNDTIRVLVHLFRADDIEARDVGAMFRELAMERSVLMYHLDMLKNSSLADMTGGNYVDGHVYWALTADGRRRAIEGKLI
jgi:hypothetical protein